MMNDYYLDQTSCSTSLDTEQTEKYAKNNMQKLIQPITNVQIAYTQKYNEISNVGV